MSWLHVGGVTATAVVLAALALRGLPLEIAAVALVGIGALIGVGQRRRAPGVTAAGMLGLVVIVGTGPAAAASWPGLLAWALPTWVVVLVAADLRPPRPHPRDVMTRVRVVLPAVLACVVAVPLLLMAGRAWGVGPGWAVAGGLATVAVTTLGTLWRTRTLPARPLPVSTDVDTIAE